MFFPSIDASRVATRPNPPATPLCNIQSPLAKNTENVHLTFSSIIIY